MRAIKQMVPGWSPEAYSQNHESVALNLYVSVHDAQVDVGWVLLSF